MRNPYLCLVIVLSLALGALTGTVGLIVLASMHVEAPQALVGTVALCYGALSSFLVQPPRGSMGGVPTSQQIATDQQNTQGQNTPIR